MTGYPFKDTFSERPAAVGSVIEVEWQYCDEEEPRVARLKVLACEKHRNNLGEDGYKLTVREVA